VCLLFNQLVSTQLKLVRRPPVCADSLTNLRCWQLLLQLARFIVASRRVSHVTFSSVIMFVFVRTGRLGWTKLSLFYLISLLFPIPFIPCINTIACCWNLACITVPHSSLSAFHTVTLWSTSQTPYASCWWHWRVLRLLTVFFAC